MLKKVKKRGSIGRPGEGFLLDKKHIDRKGGVNFSEEQKIIREVYTLACAQNRDFWSSGLEFKKRKLIRIVGKKRATESYCSRCSC